MAVDHETGRPRLSTVFGGLSGPAVRPIVMRIVYELHGALSIPVIASGGIMSSRDAVEYLMAGATAVQVGMASFLHPQAPFDVLSGLENTCLERGLSPAELTGMTRSLVQSSSQ
jgi:dihydroorotate dehydrogenase (NAD+) catalytic subunit